MSDDPRRFLRYLDAERNASLLYRALAESTDGEQREALLELAESRTSTPNTGWTSSLPTA